MFYVCVSVCVMETVSVIYSIDPNGTILRLKTAVYEIFS